MSRVYLVRHGQAGTRLEYDSLSELGRQQSRRLGEYLAAEGVRFAAAYSGTQARQQSTAAEVKAAYEQAGASFPEIVPDGGWNEFDLAGVYRALAPRMCEADAEFRGQYEEMERQAQAAGQQPDAEVNRRWLPCDARIVEAWVEGRHPCDTETWAEFQERVAGCRSRLYTAEPEANILVFTSACPIGIWAALSLEICDGRILRLAGVLQNTSLTVIRVNRGRLRLHSFNGIPHLAKPELRTYR